MTGIEKKNYLKDVYIIHRDCMLRKIYVTKVDQKVINGKRIGLYSIEIRHNFNKLLYTITSTNYLIEGTFLY